MRDHDHHDTEPGLKQAELHEAAHEGPHGSHADGTEGPVEQHGHDHHGHHEHHAMMVADFRRRFFVCLVLTVPILALSPMVQGWLGFELAFPGSVWVLTALSAVVYGYGGWPFLTGMVEELRDRRPGMMTLVAMAISVAFFYSLAVVLGAEGMLFFWETATLIDLMLVGHWIEMRSVMGASKALEELARLMPDEAHRLGPDGRVEDVPTAALRTGDRVLVRASEKVPADGVVVGGRSDVNEAALTGESVPVEKGAGDEVIAGSINGTGALTVEVRKTGAEAYLSQVIGLVREAQASRSKTQDLANRAAFYLTIVALSVGALTFAAWFLFTEAGLGFAVERAVTVMVIACPHALGLAIPLVVAVSTSLSARNGLLIRDRAAFERARALIEAGGEQRNREAVAYLESALQGEPTNAFGWRLQGIAQAGHQVFGNMFQVHRHGQQQLLRRRREQRRLGGRRGRGFQVSRNANLLDALRILQHEHQQLAIVVNEHGATEGVVVRGGDLDERIDCVDGSFEGAARARVDRHADRLRGRPPVRLHGPDRLRCAGDPSVVRRSGARTAGQRISRRASGRSVCRT